MRGSRNSAQAGGAPPVSTSVAPSLFALVIGHLLAVFCLSAAAIRPLPVPAEGRVGFELLAPAATGLAFTNVATPARHW